MRAHAGDRIVVRGRHVGDAVRDGEILEARGPEGSPPFLVRWSDTGHEGLYFPSSDAEIHINEHVDTAHLITSA